MLLVGCGRSSHEIVSAALRTWAAHAPEQIDRGDMAPVIELTKELIGAHLA